MNGQESQTAVTLAAAKSWIDNVFQRVGSSFSQQRSQSQKQSSTNKSTFQRGFWSAPELVVFGVELPNLSRLQQTCSRAFGSTGFYNTRSTLGDDSHSHTEMDKSSYLNFGQQESVHRRISVTTVDMVNEAKSGEKIRLSNVEVELESSSSSSPYRYKQNALSDDSGVSVVWRESLDVQNRASFGSNVSSLVNSGDKECKSRKYSNRDTNNDFSRNDSSTCRKGSIKPDETFSDNYMTFCETLNSLQQKDVEIESGNLRARSYTLSTRKRRRSIKKKCSFRYVDKRIPEINARVKLSLLFFKNSRQLRVIILSAESELENNTKVMCKVALIGNGSNKKSKTKRARMESGSAQFKKNVYMNTEEDDLYGYSLRVKLYRISRILQRPKLYGEAVIDMESLDVTLDTSIMVKLRSPGSAVQVCTDEDLEVISENRSIHAEALSIVQQSDDLFGWSPHLSRCRSLPHMSRHGVRTMMKSEDIGRVRK